MSNDLRFLRCLMIAVQANPHIPILHVIETVRTTLAEVDRMTVEAIEVGEAMAEGRAA